MTIRDDDEDRAKTSDAPQGADAGEDEGGSAKEGDDSHLKDDQKTTDK